MKHLMLYEAFQSKTLSDIVKYVKSKNSNNIGIFIEHLKKIQRIYDFPIEKIQPENIEYVSRSKALKMIPSESLEYSNKYRVFNIKFWFSLEEGYLGKTGTGDYELSKARGFNTEEIEYIKNNLNIKTGIIKPVSDYESLKHGDYVIGYFNDREDFDYLSQARIYKEYRKLYAIQNVSDGSYPEDSRDWTDWGNYGWSLGYNNSPNDDHSKLHLYKENDNELSYSNDIYNKELYVLSDGQLDEYANQNYTDKADFAIVLNIDNIFKKGFKKVSGIKSEREESRSGSIHFMDDEEIKSANINRYYTQIVNKMGIKTDLVSDELKDLQNIVKLATLKDLPFYSIYRDEPSIRSITSLSSYITKLLKEQDYYYYNALIESYRNIKTANRKLLTKYNQSLSIIESNGTDEIKLLFSKIEEINKIIVNYIESLKINNLYDLNAVYYKLYYIRQLIFDDIYEFTRSTRPILSNLYDPSDVEYYLGRASKSDIEEDIKKMEFLYKNIKSVLN
jgi:hypothetical protein